MTPVKSSPIGRGGARKISTSRRSVRVDGGQRHDGVVKSVGRASGWVDGLGDERVDVDLHVGEVAEEHVWPFQLQLGWDRAHLCADVGDQLLEVGQGGGRASRDAPAPTK